MSDNQLKARPEAPGQSQIRPSMELSPRVLRYSATLPDTGARDVGVVP